MYAAKSCCLRRRVQDDGRRPQYCLISDARGRLRRLFLVWQTSVSAILLMPRVMQGVLPCSSSTVNASGHNTIDAQRHGGYPYHMGVNGAHNTVGENVGAYNTVWALLCQGGCRVLFL